jgi:hypothetical protein
MGLANSVSQYVWNNLGRCMHCMRTSFLVAATGWCVVAILATLSATGSLLIVSTLVSSALTILWIAHLFAFSLKHASTGGSKILRQDSPHAVVRGISRRETLPVFLKVLALAAAGTMVLPSIAAACSVTCSGGSCDKTCNAGETCYAECNAGSGAPQCYCRAG